MSDATTPRVTTERARELLAGVQIRPTHDCCQYDYRTNGKIPCPCGYPSRLTSCGHQAEVRANYTARRALDASAEDALADLIAARETIAQRDAEIAALVVERDEARDRYRFMVERAAVASLDGYRELGATAAAAENASDALRTEIARLTADLVAITGDYTAATLRAEALSGEVLARVSAEEHARAVREAWHEGRSSAPEDYWAASPRQRNVDAAWRESSAIDDLRDLLAHRGGPERAAALADGVGGDS